MNLSQLFETQKVLRERIGYNEPDRFDKLVLALLVEIGECANELPEVFKFWSTKKKNNYEKALMEYVDGLHFVLEVGIEKGFNPEKLLMVAELNTTDSFMSVMESALKYEIEPTAINYSILFERFVELGKMIGFTWEQVQAAYFAKNQINHARQDAGY